MGIAGAIAASFFDTDTGRVVQVNHISQGSDFILSDRSEEDLDGNSVYVEDEFSLSLGFYDSGGIEQLRAWQKERTKLQFVLAGRQENILIYHPSRIRVNRPYNFNPRGRVLTEVTMQGKAFNVAAWRGMNLLNGVVLANGHDFGWGDDNGDGNANGYFLRHYINRSFAGDEQTMEVSAGAGGLYLPGPGTAWDPNVLTALLNFAFPLAGVPLTLSADVTLLHQTGANRARMTTHEYDASSVDVLQIDINQTGRYSMDIVTSPGTFGVHTRPLFIGISTDAHEMKVKFPALRTDGLATYTE